MEDIKKKITSLLNAAGVTGEYDLEIISDNLILIQTDQGTFKYTDKLYKQTKPHSGRWKDLSTGNSHRGLLNVKNNKK